MLMAARTTVAHQYHDGTKFEGITVKRHVGEKPTKPRHVVVAPYVSGRIDFGAHNNNLPNLIRALNERVFNVSTPEGLAPTPQPRRGCWRTLDTTAARLARQASKFGKVVPLTNEQFVEQCPANKRNLYTRASTWLDERGWSERDAKIKAFVKFEKLNFTKKVDPAPRVIQPRTPVYNIALGKFTRRVEADMYKALAHEWGEDDDEVVMKGMTVEEVAANMRRKWTSFANPVAVGLDASRFDQHVSKDALKWEHSIYNKIFDNHPELRALLKQQLHNKGYAFLDGHKLSYKTTGTRASGDMNTSLGNCTIMCTLIREYVRSINVEAKLVNNGDDCVLFIEKRDLHKLVGLEEYFLGFGFEMEVEEPVYCFEKVVFCQMQPVLVNHKTDIWVMVRQPSAAFAKDALCLAATTERDYRQWSFQVGTGGLALYGDMPIFGSLYECYRANGEDSNVSSSLIISDSGFMRLSKVPRCRGEVALPISDDTRVSFYKAFGYPPSLQIAMEQEIKSLRYAGLCWHPLNISVSAGLFTI